MPHLMDKRAGAVLIAAISLAGMGPDSAGAASVTRLFEDAAKALPELRPQAFRPPRVSLAPLGEATYGVADATLIARLDEAKAVEVKAVAAATAEVGRTSESSEVEAAAKNCAKTSLKKGLSGGDRR